MKVNFRIGKAHFFVFILLLTFFSFGSASAFFYFHLLVLGFLIAMRTMELLKTNSIGKYLIASCLTMVLWIVYALAITFFTFNPGLHVKYIFLSFFYIIGTLSLIDCITRDQLLFGKIVNILTTSWIIINGVLLLLFIMGYSVKSGFVQVYNNLESNIGFSGFFSNRNRFALTTVLISALYFYFSSDKTDKFKVYIGKTLVLLTFLLLSQSVKGLVGFSFIFIVHYFGKIKLKKFINSFLLFTIFVLVLNFAFNFNVFNRVKKIYQLVTNKIDELKISDSAYMRAWFFNQSIEIIKEKPLTGIGAQSSTYFLVDPYKKLLISRGVLIYKEGEPKGTYSHCNYTELGLTAGVFAIVLYYFPLFFILIALILKKQKNNILNFVLVLIILKLFIDIGMVSYYDFIHNIILSIVFIYTFKNITTFHNKADDLSLPNTNNRMNIDVP
jgi:O-antigen ligase